jgi:hypothetical protein
MDLPSIPGDHPCSILFCASHCLVDMAMGGLYDWHRLSNHCWFLWPRVSRRDFSVLALTMDRAMYTVGLHIAGYWSAIVGCHS